ncbi:hypothetical protein T265_01524 [Opisthorchis viverrini]|uniref:Uncharacterized protein n=1 Tax=Opisthorchis viverrini TaxID=6198 RepID=A0A074ZYD2_OPIVI|nr:hypothetical protein T265_01524 [Opisthorchis viverrini]KER32473.1 hypothetical protein T265_01524 [Opisthorchis viverrini]
MSLHRLPIPPVDPLEADLLETTAPHDSQHKLAIYHRCVEDMFGIMKNNQEDEEILENRNVAYVNTTLIPLNERCLLGPRLS